MEGQAQGLNAKGNTCFEVYSSRGAFGTHTRRIQARHAVRGLLSEVLGGLKGVLGLWMVSG